MQVKVIKINRYDQRIEQYRIKSLFQQDQKRVYQQLNGKIESSEKPDTEESRNFGATSREQKRVTIKILNG